MSNTYTWVINALDCIPDVNGKLDYVVTSHWSCNATDGTFSGSVYSTVSFPVNADKPDYIPFDQLTEAQVIGWTQGALGAETVAATEAAVLQQIEDQKNPKIIQPPLPWIQPSA